MRRVRFLPLVVGAAVMWAAGPAAAVPIQYTFVGTLTLGSTVDTLDLDGATLTITTEVVDTGTAPDSTSPSANNVVAFYNNVEATGVFTDRPNSAPDESVVYTTRLTTDNHFPPSSGSDAFGIGSAFASVFGVTFGMPAMSAAFGDLAFFPGTDAGPLPIFEPSDIASFSASIITQPIRYDVTVVDITAVVIPEPSTALLLGSGLALLAVGRRTRVRS